jgi:hypothetical protein
VERAVDWRSQSFVSGLSRKSYAIDTLSSPDNPLQKSTKAQGSHPSQDLAMIIGGLGLQLRRSCSLEEHGNALA